MAENVVRRARWRSSDRANVPSVWNNVGIEDPRMTAAAHGLARVDWSRHTLGIKLKILLSFTLVTAQIGDVYQVRYPPGYQTLTDQLFGIFRGLEISNWLEGVSVRCAVDRLEGSGMSSLEIELLVGSTLPVLLSIGRLAVCYYSTGRAKAQPWELRLAPSLPFVLWVSYLAYPVMVSMGFQALGECDCFERYKSVTPLCFLPARYSVQCSANTRHAPFRLLGIAIGVIVFWMLVPFALCAWLLWRCGGEIAYCSGMRAIAH